jgi:chemotaxis protein MotB
MQKQKDLFDLTELSEEIHFDQGRREAWMISFADLLSLLLVFFILIYASTYQEKITWKSLTSSIDSRFKAINNRTSYARYLDLDYLEKVIKSDIKNFLPDAKVIIILEENRLLINIAEDNLFKAYSHDLSNEGAQILTIIGQNIAGIANKIEVNCVSSQNDLKLDNAYTNNLIESLTKGLIITGEFKKMGYESPISTFGLPIINDNKRNSNFLKYVEIVVKDFYTSSIEEQY